MVDIGAYPCGVCFIDTSGRAHEHCCCVVERISRMSYVCEQNHGKICDEDLMPMIRMALKEALRMRLPDFDETPLAHNSLLVG